MIGWFAVPRDWIASGGDILKFCGQAFGDIFNARVFQFFGEALRQAGILILGSAMVIWGMVFILGLECGIEGAYFNRSVGAPAYAGVFSAWCDLREMVPYMFGYIMAAKVGTGIVAELGAMRINEEIDALQVLGVDPVKNLVVPRFLALMLVTGLLDVYALIFGIFGGVLAEMVYHQNLAGFWATFFANASVTDLWGSVVKTTIFGAIIAIVCCYKGMTASGGAAGVGRAVNEAVVIAFSGIWAFNYVFTQTLLATHPEILVIR